MLWEGQAGTARRDIAAFATSGMSVAELYSAAIEVVGQAVASELTCWPSIDPDTVVIDSMISGGDRIPPEYEPRLAEAEAAGTERDTFAELARQPFPVARVSDLPHREVVHHRRLNEIWRPLGLDHEARAAFTVDGACWGAADLARGGPEFTEHEVDFLGSVSPVIAAATRIAARTGARGVAAPAIVVTGRRGEPRAITPTARSWQGELDEIAPGRFEALMRAAVTGALAARSGTFQVRTTAANGGWVVLSASRLIIGDEDPQLVVTIGT
jgi:hypothetical protein